MPDFTIYKAVQTLTNPIDLLILFYMLVLLFFWQSAKIWQTKSRIEKRAIFFSPKYTIVLQKMFRSNFLDKFTSFVWYAVLVLSVYLISFICLFQGNNLIRIGLSVLFALNISFLIQLMFPVIVPVRYHDFGISIEGFEPIRKTSMKNSDRVNGLLYNGLPSNHVGLVVAGAWLCWNINTYDPWYGWIVFFLMFIVLIFLFSFSVIYLGEHYIQDIIAALIIFPIVLISSQILINMLIPAL